jgi:hypothetical protein
VKGTSKPAEILHKLRNLAGFCADEEIELYEVSLSTSNLAAPNLKRIASTLSVLVSHFNMKHAGNQI